MTPPKTALETWVEERRKAGTSAKAIWCDDMGSRKFGPWEEIQNMTWPDHDYVRYGIVFTDRKVHDELDSFPIALAVIEKLSEALKYYEGYEPARLALSEVEALVGRGE